MSPALARAIASFSDSLAVASVSPSFASLPLMASAKYSAAGSVALAATAMAAAKIPVTRCLSIVIPPLYFNRIIVPMTGPKL